jgi:hypothetical protein
MTWQNVSLWLASFCVWTKSLVCKDAFKQGFHYSEAFQMILHCFQDRSFQSPCQPSGRSCHPVLTPICPLFHPSGRPTDQASSVQTTWLSVRTHHCIEKILFQLRSVRMSQHLVRTPLSDRSASDLSKFNLREDCFKRPDDVDSHPDALIHKVRIAIQISTFGRQSALVRTRIHQLRKLPIRLQPSERLPIMVRTRA